MKARTLCRVGIVLGLAALCATLALMGCAEEPQPPKPTLIGRWTSVQATGTTALLDEIVFEADGTFRHSGRNALGLPVAFTGAYTLGTDEQGAYIRLTYNDYPDKPTVWYYRLGMSTLSVSTDARDLQAGRAQRYRRAPEQ